MTVTSWNSPELTARIRQAAMRGVVSWIGDVDQRAVKLIMDPPKTGTLYQRRGVKHQASAPDEAPANDEDHLEGGRLPRTRRCHDRPRDGTVSSLVRTSTPPAASLHGCLRPNARATFATGARRSDSLYASVGWPRG